MRLRRWRLLALAAWAAWLGQASATAHASERSGSQTRRFAVLVGAAKGSKGRATLRYAQDDARSVADVLTNVGDFRQDDITLLEDPAPGRVLEALDAALSAAAREPGETLLLFYYSGHADDEGLYPDGELLRFEALRARLESASATLRLGIIDACRGGSWTRAKGLSRSDAFEVKVPLAVRSEGSALIASSSGSESAQEAESLKGSYFTHHFVAGLRGAADLSGDGEVSLVESFSYAQKLTIRDSTLQTGTPQHPSFDFNFRGRSDLPLTWAHRSKAAVWLTQSNGPMRIVQASTGRLMVELPAGERRTRVALPPGTYLALKGGRRASYVHEFEVGEGAVADLHEDELRPVATQAMLVSKGLDDPPDEPVLPLPRHALIWDPLPALFDLPTWSFEYARRQGDHFSFFVNPSFSSPTPSPLGVRRAFGVTTGARFYPGGTAPRGFFGELALAPRWTHVNEEVGSGRSFELKGRATLGYSALAWRHAVFMFAFGPHVARRWRDPGAGVLDPPPSVSYVAGVGARFAIGIAF